MTLCSLCHFMRLIIWNTVQWKRSDFWLIFWGPFHTRAVWSTSNGPGFFSWDGLLGLVGCESSTEPCSRPNKQILVCLKHGARSAYTFMQPWCCISERGCFRSVSERRAVPLDSVLHSVCKHDWQNTRWNWFYFWQFLMKEMDSACKGLKCHNTQCLCTQCVGNVSNTTL